MRTSLSFNPALDKVPVYQPGRPIEEVARELGLPIQFVGVGETVEDLIPFNPKEFVESLFEA